MRHWGILFLQASIWERYLGHHSTSAKGHPVSICEAAAAVTKLQHLWEWDSETSFSHFFLPLFAFLARLHPHSLDKCTTQLLLQARNMAFETHEHKGGEQTIINETKLLLFCWQQSERKKGQRETSGKSDEGLSSGTRDENSCLPGILTNALKGDPLLIEEGGSLLCWSFVFLHHQTVKENLWAEL